MEQPHDSPESEIEADLVSEIKNLESGAKKLKEDAKALEESDKLDGIKPETKKSVRNNTWKLIGAAAGIITSLGIGGAIIGMGVEVNLEQAAQAINDAQREFNYEHVEMSVVLGLIITTLGVITSCLPLKSKKNTA